MKIPQVLNRYPVFEIITLLLLGLSYPVKASSGAVAIAVPVEGIAIDGDLSDWPEISEYSVSHIRRGSHKDKADFQASFAVGYSTEETALYIAVKVEDESVVIDTAGGIDLYSLDGCHVRVGIDSTWSEYVLHANKRDAWGSADMNDMQVAFMQQPGRRFYEWRIVLNAVNQDSLLLQAGRHLNFDLRIDDLDADASYAWTTWSPRSMATPAYLLLREGRQEFGKLTGQVSWEGMNRGVARTRVNVHFPQPDPLHLGIISDREGKFSVDLPAGKYQLEAFIGRGNKEVVDVQVEAGRSAQVALEVPKSHGLVGGKGHGRAVQAGPGIRKGLWFTFGVQDGLNSNALEKIYQDRAGNMWFGTQNGLSRYNGAEFVTFTTKDGLAGNFVRAIAEDRAGNLWFGTIGAEAGGVSRYNGEEFANFTTEDGLADNHVFSIVGDRAGNLWFGTANGLSLYDGEIFTTYTSEDGLAGNAVYSMAEDRSGHMWFGTMGRGVSRYDGKEFVTYATEDGLADNYVYSIVEDRAGHFWFGTADGVSRYDGQEFITFTAEDGLAGNQVRSIVEDREGNLWFGLAKRSGISMYDGGTFITFALEDGLPAQDVFTMLADQSGHIWLGTFGGGVTRYDGNLFAHFTTREGLADNYVPSLFEDQTGALWIGTLKGLNRFDGKEFTTFTVDDGLIDDPVWSMAEDAQGNLWFGTSEGASRYDGNEFVGFTTSDGLPNNTIEVILAEREGNVWFGTRNGVGRYDGNEFATFNTADGIPHRRIEAIFQDRTGHLWFGGGWSHAGGGVTRYDGEIFTTFTTQDGLAGNAVRGIGEDRAGNMWIGSWESGVSRFDGRDFTVFNTANGLSNNTTTPFMEDRAGRFWIGTWGSGINLYDGLVFQSISQKDGLINDKIFRVIQDKQGDIWIGTEGGLCRYRPTSIPPGIGITDVIADQSYGSIEEIVLSSTQDLIILEYQGSSLSTHPDQLAYVYRLKGRDEEWIPTRQTRLEYTNLPIGEYVFQVRAVDRDLNYSKAIAQVQVSIDPPYGQIAFFTCFGMALIGLVALSGYGIRRRRERDQAQARLVEELEEELRAAHDLQMGLMPKAGPRQDGFDIAGRCLPANHVGGDIFQYFPLLNNGLALAMADVTGHAMQAAIPVVMFSGILRSQMELDDPLDHRFGRLNRTLYDSLDERTFVCFAMGELDPSTRILRLSNGGCPYPLHYQAATGEVTELQIDAYPLGVRSDTVYSANEILLELGDAVVFCSDGIAEATDAKEEMFGFERTAETIRAGFAEGLSAEASIDRLMGTVKDFAGDVPQGDDMTVVVLKVET